MNRVLKAAACLALALAMTVSLALAQEAGVIVQSSCNIVPSGDTYLVYCFAQVHNNSDEFICMDEGVFQLGNSGELIVQERVSRMWPNMLAPGEDGYFFDAVRLDGEGGAPTVTGLYYDVKYMAVDTAYAGQKLEAEAFIEHQEDGGMTIVCRMRNETTADAYDPMIAAALYTQAGQMVYACGTSLRDVGVPVDGTVLYRMDVEDALAQQWRSYGATPTQVRVNVLIPSQMD